MITSPGIYTLPPDVYHADPCPEPSLSGSIGIPLLNRSPRHAWWRHSRLNPDYQPTHSERFDLGSVAHAMVLGAGAGIEVIDADNYTTKAAREARDAARAAGKIPVLAESYDTAKQMHAAACQFWIDAGLPSDGRAEQTMIWREGKAWCRGMVDNLSGDLRTVIDYKTTGVSGKPEDAERSLFDLNYHFKAAFYERGLNVLDPDNAGRRRFLFLFQEIEPPFECSLLAMSEGAMTIGRKQATYAIRLWQRCMETGDWPGYGSGAHQAVAPPWIEQRWMAREMSDPFATGETAPGEVMPVYPINGNAGF